MIHRCYPHVFHGIGETRIFSLKQKSQLNVLCIIITVECGTGKHSSSNQEELVNQFDETFFLSAPSGALVFIMVYYIPSSAAQQPTFSNFSNSSDSKVKVKVKGPNMCYIFEKHGIQGYRICHSRVSNVKYTNTRLHKYANTQIQSA